MPDILSLAAMKAYALGRRSKWKDYVDLYYIITAYHTISEISSKANEIFGQLFSEKQFRSQLCFFDDIDTEEDIEFIVKAPSDKEIKETLSELAIKF